MNESIIIRTDGYKVTTATLYGKDGKQIKKAKAKCSPEDTFNFKIGVKEAIRRLFTEEMMVGDEVLKIKFEQCGNEVTAKIINQDESLRGSGTICEGDNYGIRSIVYPEISETMLYLRGNDKEKDFIASSMTFGDEEEAKKYICEISKLIEKINTEAKLNTKVVCVKSHDRDSFTKGKIYSVENGKIKDDRGIYVGNYKSVDEANKNLKTGKFIEIVE